MQRVTVLDVTWSCRAWQFYSIKCQKKNDKYDEKREKDERMKHVVGGEREKKKLTVKRENR